MKTQFFFILLPSTKVGSAGYILFSTDEKIAAEIADDVKGAYVPSTIFLN